jgi:hypothetical protein
VQFLVFYYKNNLICSDILIHICSTELCQVQRYVIELISGRKRAEVGNINFFLILYHINIMAQKVIYYNVNIISKKEFFHKKNFASWLYFFKHCFVVKTVSFFILRTFF